MPKANKKILYIDGVGPFGGASRSLFEAVRELKNCGFVDPYFVHARGTASKYYRKVAIDIIETKGLARFDNTNYSHYRGVRWLVLMREVLHVPYTFFSLWQAKRRWGNFDLIHVNEITELFPGLLARKVFKCPLVVHVRSLQSQKDNLRTKFINYLLRKVEGVICIDETVSRTVPKNDGKVVIHNSFSVKRLNKDTELERKMALYRNCFRVGFVGNLQEIKGIIELVEAAAILRGQKDIKFLIIGDVTQEKSLFLRLAEKILGLSQDTKERVLSIIHKNQLEDSFVLLGHTHDISTAYENFDVLCFPSHLNAPGRPVFESAFFKIPSIVCVTEPTADTLVPEVTALIIPEKNSLALAAAIERLKQEPEKRREMGGEAYELASLNFDPVKNSEKLRLFYNQLLR